MADHYYEGQVQYIGPRFVPRFATPIEWNNEKQYEQLEMVVYLGNTYTSRKPVPAGIEITNDEYWALTGNYNYQVETYRQEVEQYKGDILDQFNNTVADLDEKTKWNIKLSPSYINNWKAVFLNATLGNDSTADGTPEKPFKTFDAAIKFGNNYNYVQYNFAEGTYQATANVNFKNSVIELKNNQNNVTLILDAGINMLQGILFTGSKQSDNYLLKIDSTNGYHIFSSCFLIFDRTSFLCELRIDNCNLNSNMCNFNGVLFNYNTKATCINCTFNQSKNLNTIIGHITVFSVVELLSGADVTIINDLTAPNFISEPSNIFCDITKVAFNVSHSILRLLTNDTIFTDILQTKYDYFVNVIIGELHSYMTTTGYEKVATTGTRTEGGNVTIFPLQE